MYFYDYDDFYEAYIVKWCFSTTWALGATFLTYCQKNVKIVKIVQKMSFNC
jgi:hypothetical protein